MRLAALWLCRIVFFSLMMFSAYMAAGWGGVIVIGIGVTCLIGIVTLERY